VTGIPRFNALVSRDGDCGCAQVEIWPFLAFDFAVQNFLLTDCAFLRTSPSLCNIMGLSGVLRAAASPW
jgi:hypothetical protein